MKINHLVRFTIIFCIVAAAVLSAAAQGDAQTRSITSDSFTRNRVAPQQSASAPKIQRFNYKFVRSDRNAVHHAPSKRSVVRPIIIKPSVTDIGITMWRLRPPVDNEKGLLLLPVQGDKGERNMWLAERVATDSVFKAGERVRFAVETSTPGYLYVIDRETLGNGALGEPLLIFPTSEKEDNSIKPGMLFDFPDRNDQWPYLKINPKKANYSGELLTVIISPKPLTGIRADKDGYVKNGILLTDLEYGSNVDIYSRTDSSDLIYSKPESDGSCGIRTRELRPEKSADSPCGSASRLLTRDEPMPQSIYRVIGTAGQPAVAFIKLTVR